MRLYELRRTRHRLGGANAEALLRWQRPAAPRARATKQWECAGCHGRHEEAVLPTEALPEDHVYYEKFDRRYCSMHCMSAHRKANFVSSFSCAPPPSAR